MMNWTQVTDPFGNLFLSLLVAIVPIAFIFWALIIRKMKGYIASLLTTAIAVLIAILVYKMPVSLAVLSTLHGALYGIFPICWIIISAVFLFNITVHSGQFEVIKHFMAGITSDRRLQALLIAFSFGSFLEGTAGFGTPVAISASMLVGLGFNPLYAAGICLIANTAPVAFGAIGTPIIVASQVSGIPENALSQMVGRTLPALSLILPFYLIMLMAGFKKTRDIWPAILVSGSSFAFFQWFSSNYLGPTLPDVIAAIGSIAALGLFLRFWKPKEIWRFKDEPATIVNADIKYGSSQIVRAWSPFIILTIMVLAWGYQPIKDALNHWGQSKFDFPGLHNHILHASNNQPLAQVFRFNYLSASGTAILFSALLSIPVLGVSFKDAGKIFVSTLNQLKYPVITIAAVLGFAYIVNNSGITLTMADALSKTGFLFPFFAPILGWLGVFITGSDTSSNALFGKLQAATANSIGVDPVVTVGANISGGVVGKMISPQSIAVAAAAGNLIGRESELFRFTVKHSFILLFLICIITMIQAYVLQWIIPKYELIDKTSVVIQQTSEGNLWLVGLAVLMIFYIILLRILNRKHY